MNISKNMKLFFQKYYFTILCVIIAFVFFLVMLLVAQKIDYTADNYRYIFSSIMQINGSIFAFIASSTLLAYQLLFSSSPRLMAFFPKKVFIMFLVSNSIFLSLDILSLQTIEHLISVPKQIIYITVITLNIFPIIFAIYYVLLVIKMMSPTFQIKQLKETAKKSKNNDERLMIIYSLEELFITSIRNGQGGNIRLLQNTLSEIIKIYSTTNTFLNKGSNQNPYHPLRIIPAIIERISFSLLDNDMNNLLHFHGHILRELSSTKYGNQQIVDVEIASAIESIGEICVEKNKIIDCKNFIANLVFCIDKTDSTGTILWGISMLIETLKNYLNLYPIQVLEILQEITDCIMRKGFDKDTDSFNSIIFALDDSRILKNCDLYKFTDLEKTIIVLKTY